MNNLLVDVAVFSLFHKKLYSKQSFNNISGNCGHLFSQINFDQIYFFGGGLAGGLSRRFLCGGLCPGTGFNKPSNKCVTKRPMFRPCYCIDDMFNKSFILSKTSAMFNQETLL